MPNSITIGLRTFLARCFPVREKSAFDFLFAVSLRVITKFYERKREGERRRKREKEMFVKQRIFDGKFAEVVAGKIIRFGRHFITNHAEAMTIVNILNLLQIYCN